jgi:uncharacterized repeat protein (TIGR01451 family)
MNRNRRLGGYLLAVLVLFGVALVAPRAWATPSQARSGQGGSVPTLTPVGQWSPKPPTSVPPTEQPTDRPTDLPVASITATPLPPAAVATNTPISPAATPIDGGSGAALVLAKAVDRLETWPGATVWFTLTATNPGAASARQIVLADVLPAELDPGVVLGTSAAWDGRTLRGLMAVLPPAGTWVITFSAIVRQDAVVGRLVINSAEVWAAGGLHASADAYLALPPAELPAVGGGTDELRLP